jgi:hypothetical protein
VFTWVPVSMFAIFMLTLGIGVSDGSLTLPEIALFPLCAMSNAVEATARMSILDIRMTANPIGYM